MKIEENIVNGILVKNIIYEDSDIRTQEEKNNILDICNVCIHKQGDFCENCGCLLESRMYYKEIGCPINKW